MEPLCSNDPLDETIRDLNIAQEAAQQVTLDLPEDRHVRVHRASNHDESETGISYQKCGGGRRIIKKHIGGS